MPADDLRSKAGRSAAAATTAARPNGRRSQSEDSAHIAEKPRSNAKTRSSKKGSQHADVIDRLDYTGVGPMFHHDGPFDACAPSRNKHRNKAPMMAWGDDIAAVNAPAYGDSAYPAPHAFTAFSNNYPEPPKKKVDAIAEAWGIHEPEPFEEFFAGGGSARTDGDTPASSIYNGKDSQAKSAKRRDDRESRPRVATRRTALPPPQPIFVGEPEMDPSSSPPASSPGFPKRSKSLMHRIRRMRDAPNVPVGPDYSDQPPSPTSPVEHTRPTHRPQNSFLGRFANPQKPQQNTTTSEPFVLIETMNKDLPPPPPVNRNESTPPAENNASTNYFDQNGSGNPPASPGGQLNRKTSLIKKMGRVVRGTK